MKKLFLMVAVVLFGLVLTACDNLGPREKSLRNALKSLSEASNYQINIKIDDQDEEFNMVLKFDGELSYFKMNEVEEYYEETASRMVVYRVVGDKVTVTREDKKEADPYQFLSLMTYDLFEYVESADHYLLINGNETLPKQFVQTVFENAIVANFKISVTGNVISEVLFDIVHNDEVFPVQMTYSNFGSVSLTLPTV
ncbi:hypothetical protein LJC17_00635 [Acholeplasma sp. OttesenSCG-928-E16]|nr:hypothetical protein [Acholeplasma sp. OttesenSCG-928-E16]